MVHSLGNVEYVIRLDIIEDYERQGSYIPKGDPQRIQNSIDSQGSRAQNALTNTFNNQLPQNQSLQNRYNVSADRGQQDYGNIMGNYNDLLSRTGNSYNNARSGFQNFADTGGYSPSDIAALRARAIAPTRAVYANAQSNLDRNKSLQGYSPNYAAATSKLTRDLSQSTSDANINTEAALADNIRQGKLAGLGGLNATDTAQLGAFGNALTGQRGLYGTAPGEASMYGTQLGQSNNQMLDMSQLQNAISEMIINGQLGRGKMPTRFDAFNSAAQGVGSLIKPISKAAS